MVKARNTKWYVTEASDDALISDKQAGDSTYGHGFVRVVAGITLVLTFICALVFSAATLYILLVGEMNFPAGLICLLVNIALWGASVRLWNFLNPETTHTGTKTGIKPVVSASRHWWTNTPLREENQQRLGR